MLGANIILQAEAQYIAERRLLAVAAVKRAQRQAREQESKGLWQRLIEKLPFTITWKTK